MEMVFTLLEMHPIQQAQPIHHLMRQETVTCILHVSSPVNTRKDGREW